MFAYKYPFYANMQQFPPSYIVLFCKCLIDNTQAQEIMLLLQSSDHYTGSDWSVKDGCATHTYGFTSSKSHGKLWDMRAVITPGVPRKMSSSSQARMGNMDIGGVI